MAQYPVNADYQMKIGGTRPITVAAGGAVVVDARGMNQLTIITGATSTATVSRVDVNNAGADAADAAGNATVNAATMLTIAVNWPFYRVTAATAPVRVCCV